MKKLLLFLSIVVSTISCGKSGDVVPDVAVSFSASVTDPRLSALTVPGRAVLINGYGVAGLILYRNIDGGYSAYDRCSSYMPQNHCAVTLDTSGFTVTDPCSGAKWLLEDGTPQKAPATRSLKAYNISVSGGVLYVNN